MQGRILVEGGGGEARERETSSFKGYLVSTVGSVFIT
jgi:hypothetical protein